MTLNFIAKDTQLRIIEWVCAHKRCAIFAPMGSGKTVSTLTALHDLSSTEAIYPILILAPLRVAKHTWLDEIAKWRHLSSLKTSAIVGSVSEREKALSVSADVYTVNYENLAWLVTKLDKKWPFKTVVVDESTKLKGFRLRQGTQRAKALATVAHTLVKRVVLLTGTPAPNGVQDLWGQLYFVDKGERLEKSFSKFLDKWFTVDYSGYNWTPLPHAQAEIQNAISDICLTVTPDASHPKDVPIVNKIMIKLAPKVRSQYRQMEKEMFLQLESEGVEALNAATVSTKCAQIANGAIYKENKSYEVLHDEKIDALASCIEETGAPVLVVYNFKSDLDRLRRAFPHGRKLGDSASDMSDWNRGQIPILFIHPMSAAHGLNLQHGGNVLIFFSISWNLEEHLQVIERIGPLRQRQAGYDRHVFIYYILAEDTIDELILERLETKRSIQEVLLTAMMKKTKEEPK